jgi:hypothetical protein
MIINGLRENFPGMNKSDFSEIAINVLVSGLRCTEKPYVYTLFNNYHVAQ